MGRGKLMTYADVAALLSCSTDTVVRLWKKGLIEPPQEFEGIGLRFWEADVLEYLYSQRAKQRRAGFKQPEKKAKRPSEPEGA